MDEQTQAQFVQWLGTQLNVTNEEELQQAVEQLDEEQMQQMYSQFQQESQAQAFKKGGQIKYLSGLKAFKKGGTVKSASIKNGTAATRKVHSAVGGYKPSKKWDFGTAKQKRVETKKLTLNSLVNKNKIKTK